MHVYKEKIYNTQHISSLVFYCCTVYRYLYRTCVCVSSIYFLDGVVVRRSNHFDLPLGPDEARGRHPNLPLPLPLAEHT